MKSCDSQGFGKKHGHPIILLLDGHTSRWSYKGLNTLIEAGIFPFFIGSHTSAWHQPNDCGINALWKAEYGKAVQLWRSCHPFMTFDRVAFNWCANRAILECNLKLAADLASWQSKLAVLKASGIVNVTPAKGETGQLSDTTVSTDRLVAPVSGIIVVDKGNQTVCCSTCRTSVPSHDH